NPFDQEASRAPEHRTEHQEDRSVAVCSHDGRAPSATAWAEGGSAALPFVITSSHDADPCGLPSACPRDLLRHGGEAPVAPSPRGRGNRRTWPNRSFETALAHDPAEEREGVASSDFLDVRVGVAPLDQTTDDVLAIRWGLQAIEVGRRQLFRLPTQNDPMKRDVIAHTGIGADAHMLNADELNHIVIVIQDAV